MKRNGPYPKSPAERLWPKVKVHASGCWIWQGAKTGSGYGAFKIRPRNTPYPAHRIAWELRYGPVPEGLWVLHRCDVRLCINPDHLFVGTRQENMDDASAKRRFPKQRQTHCIHGHAFTPENTMYRNNGKHRQCRTCTKTTEYRRWHH